MKFRNIFIITIILLVTFSISAISAEAITNETGDNIALDVPSEDIVSSNLIVNDDAVLGNSSDGNSTDGNSSSIETSDLVKYYRNATQFEATFYDNNGTLLVNQAVQFTINGVTYNRTTNDVGYAKFSINLGQGSYVIKTTNLVTNESVFNNVTVLPTIYGKDITKLFKNDTQYYVNVIDGQGNLLANTTVTFNINGALYERKTNENGTARLNINLNQGNYTITAMSGYNNDITSNKITVLPTIFAKDVTKLFKNDTQYYVNVIDGQGNPLANSTVSLNINGVVYKRDTNENGTARLNINLNPGKYTITATSYNGDIASSTITVLSTIQSKDIKKYYKNDTQFYANFTDSQGNPLVNTTVTFNINGVLYKRDTNENGTARMNINLNPGKYTITSINPSNGDQKANTVQVVSTIEVKNSNTGGNISMEYNSGSKFTVALHYNNGTLAPGKTVTFNINGVTYDRTSNENGTASLTINLVPGNYVITSSFDGCVISNLIKVRITPSVKLVSSTVKVNQPIQFYLTEKNTGNPITGQHYGILYFNGTTYGAYPDANGLVSFKQGLPTGNYLFYMGTIDDGYYSSILLGNTIKIVE